MISRSHFFYVGFTSTFFQNALHQYAMAHSLETTVLIDKFTWKDFSPFACFFFVLFLFFCFVVLFFFQQTQDDLSIQNSMYFYFLKEF